MVVSYFNYLWDIEGISAGSAIKAKEFVAALRRLDHTVHLEWRTPQPASEERATGNGAAGEPSLLQKYLREPKRLLVNAKNLVQEYRILKRQNPDIFFPRLTYGNVSCLWLSRWLNLPTVVEADCPVTYEWLQFYARDAFRFGDLSMRLELATLHQADAVITQSNQLRDFYIEHGVASEKMFMIPNAADIDKFQPRDRDAELAAKYRLQDKTVIGWIGAGVSWTGIEALVDVCNELLRTNPWVCFLMLGSQKNMQFFRENLGNYNGDRERVILPGFVPHDEIARYLSCMDVVLAPYPKLEFFYASSMKLFEYMAAGKAVLATRIGQIAEVVDEGRNGFLFDPERPGELREKLMRLVESPELRKDLGANARADAEREYNWDRVAEKMTDVFEMVLEKRRQTAVAA